MHTLEGVGIAFILKNKSLELVRPSQPSVSYLFPPASHICGDIETNQESDNLGHVLHQQAPSFEQIAGPFLTRITLFYLVTTRIRFPFQVSACIGLLFLALFWTQQIILIESLYYEVKDQIHAGNQKVSQDDVPPPPQL